MLVHQNEQKTKKKKYKLSAKITFQMLRVENLTIKNTIRLGI